MAASSPWTYAQQGLRLLLITLAGLTSIYVVIVLYRIITLPEPAGAPFFESARLNHLLLIGHGVFALPPLILGFFAFELKFTGKMKLHRWIGTIYCSCIWISAVMGVMLASANTHGMAAKLGFATLGAAWFFTTLIAYLRARQKKFPSHRQWMIRSFSLTLAVVTVRFLFLFPPASIPYEQWYPIVTWLCWVPNLLLAEMYVRMTNYAGKPVWRT